jgi:hypothetical protein
MTGDERLLNALRALDAGRDLPRSARIVLAEQAALPETADAGPVQVAFPPEGQPMAGRFAEQARALGLRPARPRPERRFHFAMAAAGALFAAILLNHTIRFTAPAADVAASRPYPQAPQAQAALSTNPAPPRLAAVHRKAPGEHLRSLKTPPPDAASIAAAHDDPGDPPNAFAPYRVRLFRAPDPQFLRAASVRLSAPVFHFNRDTAASAERASLVALPYPRFPGYPPPLVPAFPFEKEDYLAQR